MARTMKILLVSAVITVIGLYGGFRLGQQTGQRIFPASLSYLVYPPAQSPVPQLPPETSILITGDVMLGRGVNRQSLAHADFSWPFLSVQSVLKLADITVSNLENPIITDCPVYEHGFIFCAPSESVTGLTGAGIDIVSLANNHTTNFGTKGLTETISYLNESHIASIGTGAPARKTVNGTVFAFLGYNDIGKLAGVAQADRETIRSDIQKIGETADVIIVFFHWGAEYERKPSGRQQELAHASVEAGADFVVGAHPHWVQTKEVYNGVPIYYSLGNFIFDQEWSQETKEGMAIRLVYQKDQLQRIDELPVLIQDYGQPRWMDSSEKAAFYRKF